MQLEPAVQAAQIAAEAAGRAATFSLVSAGVTIVMTTIVAIANIWNARAVARLTAKLAEEKSETDAKRDYEYEARKRLYKECEPVLFRLVETAESALHRVGSLARSARNGNLKDDNTSWLNDSGYYMSSTIYHLLAPMAVLRLLQDRLTLADLRLDLPIQDQYLLAKILYVVFTDDFKLASSGPKELPYHPYRGVNESEHTWKARLHADQPRHWRQGISLGRLDNGADGLIVGTGDQRRLATYGEFLKTFEADLKAGGSTYGHFHDVFYRFHPRRRPVLWRVLVAEAVICRHILLASQARLKISPTTFRIDSEKELRERLAVPTSAGEPDVTAEALAATETYLQERYADLFKRVRDASGQKVPG